ncbi:hypothetical protein Hypma_002604 [Hypsizygus marmoreus]|uniref:Uncharacterized protein n=1 Tax=Hypsizygus marmoreus TaxID=39966 RepID=A0A369J416_HYPMA|nr:hypothetical protein Hypma_002604 [Hypsizygus marmoreus]
MDINPLFLTCCKRSYSRVFECATLPNIDGGCKGRVWQSEQGFHFITWAVFSNPLMSHLSCLRIACKLQPDLTIIDTVIKKLSNQAYPSGYSIKAWTMLGLRTYDIDRQLGHPPRPLVVPG